jgi:hypothetical protein
MKRVRGDSCKSEHEIVDPTTTVGVGQGALALQELLSERG